MQKIIGSDVDYGLKKKLKNFKDKNWKWISMFRIRFK